MRESGAVELGGVGDAVFEVGVVKELESSDFTRRWEFGSAFGRLRPHRNKRGKPRRDNAGCEGREVRRFCWEDHSAGRAGARYRVNFMAAAYQAGQVRFCAVVTSEGSQQDDDIGVPRDGTKTRHGDGAQSQSRLLNPARGTISVELAPCFGLNDPVRIRQREGRKDD